MANIQNLKMIKTKEEAVKLARKGGLARAAKIKARKTLREELLALLENDNAQEKMSIALLKKAQKGDVRAYETIRDTIGEKPVEKIGTFEIKPPVINDDIG